MAFVKSVEDLEVFQRSYRLALEIHHLTLNFPKYEQYGGVADQLRKCSKSVPANIAEGHTKRLLSAAEFKRFLMIALGSSEEMRIWIKFARDLKYFDETTAARFEQEVHEITKMIFGLHKSWSK